MRVVASPEAVAFVRERGGRLFLWPKSARCCRSVTWLESSTEPKGDREFRRVSADGLELYVPVHMREPDELEIALRRFPRPHIESYWDGCAWVV
jgi:hypothetical protein